MVKHLIGWVLIWFSATLGFSFAAWITDGQDFMEWLLFIFIIEIISATLFLPLFFGAWLVSR